MPSQETSRDHPTSLAPKDLDAARVLLVDDDELFELSRDGFALTTGPAPRRTVHERPLL